VGAFTNRYCCDIIRVMEEQNHKKGFNTGGASGEIEADFRKTGLTAETGFSENPGIQDSIERTMDEAVKSLDKIPDTREEKIIMVKRRLQSGYYDIPDTRELLITKLIHFLQKSFSGSGIL